MNPPTAAEAANLAYRVRLLEDDVKELGRKLDRLTSVLIGLCVTIAASSIVFALTVTSIGGR